MRNLLDNEQLQHAQLSSGLAFDTLHKIMDRSPEFSCIIKSCYARMLPGIYRGLGNAVMDYDPKLAGVIDRCGEQIAVALEEAEQETT